MCTVTFIPQPDGHFILTSNRDEQEARSPEDLTSVEIKNQVLLFPRDTVAGGTWIAVSSNHRAACILNGAFEEHFHKPPYRKSRGILVLELLEWESLEAFLKGYDFEGIEPFTLVVAENNLLFEIRWDESQLYFNQLDYAKCHIWSSVKLYNAEACAAREKWFEEWLTGRQDFSRDAVKLFHSTGGQGDSWNGFVMNRLGLVKTVSITSVIKSHSGFLMSYDDLIRRNIVEKHLSFGITTNPGTIK